MKNIYLLSSYNNDFNKQYSTECNRNIICKKYFFIEKVPMALMAFKSAFIENIDLDNDEETYFKITGIVNKDSVGLAIFHLYNYIHKLSEQNFLTDLLYSGKFERYYSFKINLNTKTEEIKLFPNYLGTTNRNTVLPGYINKDKNEINKILKDNILAFGSLYCEYQNENHITENLFYTNIELSEETDAYQIFAVNNDVLFNYEESLMRNVSFSNNLYIFEDKKDNIRFKNIKGHKFLVPALTQRICLDTEDYSMNLKLGFIKLSDIDNNLSINNVLSLSNLDITKYNNLVNIVNDMKLYYKNYFKKLFFDQIKNNIKNLLNRSKILESF